MINKDKYVSTCVSIYFRNQLQANVMDFKNIKILLNICGTRDDTHQLLVDCPNRRITLVQMISLIEKIS